MPTFVYKAIDTNGQEVTATLDAANREAVLDRLNLDQLCPVEVTQQDARQSGGITTRWGRISKTDIEAFTRQLANLLAAGVPLSRALHIQSREATRPIAKELWTAIHDHVSGGMSLADALASFPQHFPPVTVAMVRAGETGGFLDLVLEQIANFRNRERDLTGKVKAALIYPTILAILAAGILVFLLTYFIPRFSTMFEEFGGALPTLTQAIVTTSALLVRFWYVGLLLLTLIIFTFHRVTTTDEGRRSLERFILRVPLLGKAVGRFALVRFCSMLGTLVQAGVPLLAALRTASEAIGNQVLVDALGDAIDQVQRGQSLARSLQLCPALFPPSVVEMVSVAEESGRLDKELLRLATSYEEELDRHLKMMVALAEPALLFLIAVLVGTVVIGMLLPIFNLQELIR